MPPVTDPALLQHLNSQAAPVPAPQAQGMTYVAGPPAAAPGGYQATPGGVTPIHGGPADPTRPGGPQDPETQLTGPGIDLLADQWLMTRELPPLGMGGSNGARQRILNRAAEMAAAASHGAGDLVTQAANYRTLRTALGNQQTQLANIQSQERTATANLAALSQAAHALPGQTETRLVNSGVHMAQGASGLVPGHTAEAAYNVAYNTAINEYARLISMGSSGNGQLTDAARAEAQRMIPYGSGPDALDAAIAQAHIDMGNRRSSYEQTVAHLQAQIAGRPDPAILAHASGVVGPAGMISGNVPPPNGAAPTGNQPPPQGPGPPPSTPQQQTGPIQFGARPQTPTGFEQSQIHAYDAFMQAYPHATAEQLQAAFPNVSNARQIVAFRDQRGVVAPGSSWVMARPNAPAADITGSRGGSPEATARQITENTISQGVPLIGGIVQADQALRGPEAGNALLHGGQDWALLGGRDELAAGMNALLGNGGYGQNVAQERGVDAYDSEHHFGDRLTGQIAAGLPEALLPGGLPAQVARSGAQGAAYGFGSGEGSFANRAGNALVGGGIGLTAPIAFNLAGRAAGPVANFLSRPFRSGVEVTPAGQEIAQAGAAEEVPLSRPMVDPTSRDRMAYLDSSPGSGNLVRAPLEDTRAAIEGRAGQFGAGGTAQEPGTMGDIIQNAGQRELKQTRTGLQRGYDRAGQLAAGAPIYGREIVDNLDARIAQLNQNPSTNAPVIKYLNTVRSDFVDEHGSLIPKTIEDVRDIRTGLRGSIDNQNLTQSKAEMYVTSALDAGRRDIKRDLSDIGTLDPSSPTSIARRAAYDLFRRTDIGWGQQARFQRQVLDRIIGPADNPKLGGAVMGQIRALAAGDNPSESSRLTRLWGSINPQERLDTAATVASTFGRKAADEPFSPAQFITTTRTIQPSARALMFGPEGAQSIANLRKLSQAYRDTSARLNNSRSGQVLQWGRFFKELVGGNISGALAGVAGGGGITGTMATAAGTSAAVAGIGLLARRLSARTLMSPDMSRWLAVAPLQTTAPAIRTHIARLSVIASRDPAIAQEVLGLRNALANAVNDNAPQMGAAAASPDGGPNEQQ